MKTSHKLLIGFAVLVVAGMLAFNISLRAEYVRLKEHPLKTTITLQPFKHIRYSSDYEIRLVSGNSYSLTMKGGILDSAQISYSGDTLIIKGNNIYNIAVQAPQISSVSLLNRGAELNIDSTFKTPSLSIVSKSVEGRIAISSANIDSLRIETIPQNTVFISNLKSSYTSFNLPNRVSLRLENCQLQHPVFNLGDSTEVTTVGKNGLQALSNTK
jgi:hypothetical protein